MVELLKHGADPNLTLSGVVKNALCAAVSTTYEQQRTTAQRIALVSALFFLISEKALIFISYLVFLYCLMNKLLL